MDIQKRIDEALEKTLENIYTEKGINTGDISPPQLMEWDKITRQAAALFAELIEQNKGGRES